MSGRLIVVSGASQCGKTTKVMQLIRNEKRVIAWDIEDQFSKMPGFQRVTSKAELLRLAQMPGAYKLAYVVGGDLKAGFDYWAGCVNYAGRYVGGLTCVAEELADVTTPSKAPGNWGILLRRGLKRDINIIAISQRWAEADKTAMGNASEFIMFRTSTADDSKYLASKTRVEQSEIDGLKPFEFLRYDAVTREKTRGKVQKR